MITTKAPGSIAHFVHHTRTQVAGVPHSFATGELHAFRVRKVFPEPNTHAAEEPIVTLHGTTASHGSLVNNAVIRFVPDQEDIPEPIFDPEHRRIFLFYPMDELREVMRVLRSKKERLCYFWRSRDERRMLAWLIAMP